jgi:catechol 2,3-dioxygenase-like lactoylglutathione lyase family enzyme
MRFYDAVLTTLGTTRLAFEGDAFAGHGVCRAAFIWIGRKPSPLSNVHAAFAAGDRAAADRFHAAAIRAGGADNRCSRLRPRYHSDYYAAFVIDRDGHNIEAVCRSGPSAG